VLGAASPPEAARGDAEPGVRRRHAQGVRRSGVPRRPAGRLPLGGHGRVHPRRAEAVSTSSRSTRGSRSNIR
jgi:hypothetical protein